MSHGDFAPLEEIVGPGVALDHTKRFGKFWPEWESTLGRYRGAQILITTPTGSRLSTYIQLNFERGSQVIRAAQREGGPVSFSRGGLSASSVFSAVPIGCDQFSYFDFRSGKNVRIEFPTTNDGRVSEMVLHLPKTELRFPVAAQ